MIIKNILDKILVGIMLCLLLKNMSIVLAKPNPIEESYFIIASVAVIFNWDTDALCGSAIISVLLRMYLKV